jgi:hypothetical protein
MLGTLKAAYCENNVRSLGMITVCPLCEAKVRLPEKYESDSRCSCPRCLGTFSMSQLLDVEAPMLRLLDIDPDRDDLALGTMDDYTADLSSNDTIELPELASALGMSDASSSDTKDTSADTIPMELVAHAVDSLDDSSSLKATGTDSTEGSISDDDDFDLMGDESDDDELSDASFEELLRETNQQVAEEMDDQPDADFEIEELKGSMSELDGDFQPLAAASSDVDPLDDRALDNELAAALLDDSDETDDSDATLGEIVEPLAYGQDEEEVDEDLVDFEQFSASLDDEQPVAGMDDQELMFEFEPETTEERAADEQMITDDEEMPVGASAEQKDTATDFEEFDFGAAEEAEVGAVPAVKGKGAAGATESGIKPVPAFQIKPADEEAGPNGRRGRRGKKSPLVEGFKIVAGGIAGLLIAQLILWWLPEAWRKDPFSLAPKLPNALAILAPDGLRNPSTRPSSPIPGPLADTGDLFDDSSDSDGFGDGSPLDDDDSSSTASSDLGESFNQAQDAAIARGELDERLPPTPTDTAASDDLATPAAPGTDLADSDSSGLEGILGVDADEPAQEDPGLIDPPNYSRNDLAAALANARGLAETVMTKARSSDPADRQAAKAAAPALNDALGQLGETVTFVSTNGSDPTVDSVHQFLLSLPKVILQGGGLIKAQSAAEGGIVVTGEVVSINSVGALQEIKLQLTAPNKSPLEVDVITLAPENGQSMCQVGDEVIICGRLIESPLTSLTGYIGQAKHVIWARHALPVQ